MLSNLTLATDFLEAMFKDMERGTNAVTCAFPGDPEKDGRWGGMPWRPGQALPPYWVNQNVYLAVSTFIPDTSSGRTLYPRRKTHFVALRGVMVDDIGTKVAPDRVRLPLSARVETSPNNFQGFLFVKQDQDSHELAIATRLIEAMVESGLTADGADPGMKGVTRYGRLPCGINGKAKYRDNRGQPFTVRLREFNPDRRYTVAEIAAAHGLNMTPKPERLPTAVSAETAADADKDFHVLLTFFEGHRWYRGRNAGGWHEVRCPWESDHTSRTATGTALMEPNEHNRYQGGFRCFHGHCDGRGISDVWRFFDALTCAEVAEVDAVVGGIE
jgi:hypothetical protein